MTFSISVIFTTHDAPELLEKALWGFDSQTYNDFQIVIAEDGSTDDTRELIERIKNETDFDIANVWQADEGFQKCRILNWAILEAKACVGNGKTSAIFGSLHPPRSCALLRKSRFHFEK